MWKFESALLTGYIGIKFKLYEKDKPMTYASVIENWQNSVEFRQFYNSILAKSPYQAFYWETPPIKLDNQDQVFEFVLIDSPYLYNEQPDENAFAEYFEKEKLIVNFSNLGKDAHLIVPCPLIPTKTYTHLGNFVRQAPENQIDMLWQTVGNELAKAINPNLRWLSTAGLGVSWLHIRIDKYPKYYRFQPYSTMS